MFLTKIFEISELHFAASFKPEIITLCSISELSPFKKQEHV